MARTVDVEFPGPAGERLAGTFFPADGTESHACVVLQHGFGGLKEMYVNDYAEVLQSAGISALTYDHPGFGKSAAHPGLPEDEIDPWVQARALQDALTYVAGRADVDAVRLGVWGTSYGAGNALIAAAIDHRVKAVVVQVPFVNGPRTFDALIPVAQRPALFDAFAQDRLGRACGADAITIPLVAREPSGEALPGLAAYEFSTRAAASRAPWWRNKVTLRSLELVRGHDPSALIGRIAPTPLLMILAAGDELVPASFSLDAFNAAGAPKRLETVEGGHFDIYTGTGFERSSRLAEGWFAEHLAAVA